MSESNKPKRKVTERRPAGIKAMPAPPPRVLPEDHPARSLFKEVARDEATPPVTSTPTTPTTPTTTPTTPTTAPIAPARDFMRVPNSIIRDALPAGFFTGKRKQIYDYLYSVTRGAVVPTRSVRITMETLAIKADIGSDRTLRKHLRHLVEAGLLSVNEIGGAQGGNEFTVFIPEEVTPTTHHPHHPHHPYHPSQKVPVVRVVESGSGGGGLSVDIEATSGQPKTSFKTNTERDDDEAFAIHNTAMKKAVKEITGRELTAAEAARWGELADVLVTELKIAAGRTTVSSVPAFLAEHLRRRLWKKEKRQIDAEAAEQKTTTSVVTLDASKCTDCFGTGMYYPEGFEKGVARCPHAKLAAGGES